MSVFQPQTNVLNEENRHGLRQRTTKRDESQQQNGQKRAALGTITNQVRRQPHRAVKQPLNAGIGGIQDENAFVKSAKNTNAFAFPQSASQPFSIHVDEEQNLQQTHQTSQIPANREPLQLHSAVTNLPRPALSTLGFQQVSESHDASTSDSPMVLDDSVVMIDMEPMVDVEEVTTSKSNDEIVYCVSEYADDIYSYMRSAELRNRSKPAYMKKQPDITNSMRSILVDWLAEVAEEYKLHRETLHLAVNYIDRFLSQMSVLRGKLQLVGAASMFLAAKFEEIYPPDVGEFVYITDDTYSKKQVLRMEHLILKVLSFEVAVPTIHCFTDWFLTQLHSDEKTQSLASYLGDLTLVDSEPYLKYLPSVISAASVCLANWTLHNTPWDSEMQRVTGYSFADIEPCFRDLHKTACAAPDHPQQALCEKYKSSKYHEVSSVTFPDIPLQ
ncbi:G2/mitotic-specific cyclin-A-like [Tubulanus polymorphus]|uniref:G2/mitotic-specific cyclin-A-like n=1 Tax=Tubulanus polymorphus TaxID=672921 RepID=UPI003DA3645E